MNLVKSLIPTLIVYTALQACAGLHGEILGVVEVKSQTAPIYRGNQTIATALKGDKLHVIAIQGDWYGVLKSGWISKKDVVFHRRSADTKTPEKPKQEWELVAQFGLVRTVYVSASGIEDKHFIAQVLHSIINKHDKKRPIQIMIFDDKQFTPKGVPMTDAQMLHQRAQYNKNPNTNHERFVWLTVVDKSKSPPEIKEIEARIRPGLAE